MKAKSNDDLTRALALLRQTARTAKPGTRRRSARNARAADIGELFLAELRVRRARLKEWIEMLNREAMAAHMRPRVRTPLSAPSYRNRRGISRSAA